MVWQVNPALPAGDRSDWLRGCSPTPEGSRSILELR